MRKSCPSSDQPGFENASANPPNQLLPRSVQVSVVGPELLDRRHLHGRVVVEHVHPGRSVLRIHLVAGAGYDGRAHTRIRLVDRVVRRGDREPRLGRAGGEGRGRGPGAVEHAARLPIPRPSPSVLPSPRPCAAARTPPPRPRSQASKPPRWRRRGSPAPSRWSPPHRRNAAAGLPAASCTGFASAPVGAV